MRKSVAPPDEAEGAAATIHREAAKLLEGIGRPDPVPFVADAFQLEALERIEASDVLVSAPTGSGKTWIAVQACHRLLERGGRVWYATPLKALSNAKFEEFGREFGESRVGILTGDRKENPDAEVIVGTTEILRNQLYDAMELGEDLGVDLVILDEAHYLGDPDRGVVWEEVLIYLPGRVRLMLLSATVGNAGELAAWLSHVRNRRCVTVVSKERPVPLHVLFITPAAEITPFLRGPKLFPAVAACAGEAKKRRFGVRRKPGDLNWIVDAMREFNLLPALVFLKSRAECDKALEELTPAPLSPEEGGFAQAVEEQVALCPELKGQRQTRSLLEKRAASHHAGQLPSWRLLVERMMVQGHVGVIFATSTVAAGVNFPARTVAFLQSDRFDGASFADLTAVDLHQMTGRAGRRGIDKAGFTLVVPGPYMNVGLVKRLLLSAPEPLRSNIAVNFSMVLNLLLSHDMHGVEDLLGLSFAAFHENPKKAEKVRLALTEHFNRHLDALKALEYVDQDGQPTYDGRWAARLRLDHPLLIAQLIREGAFEGLAPKELAAFVAPFVVDKDREIVVSKYLWDRTRGLWKRFRRAMGALRPLASFLSKGGFPVPSVMFWPAATAFLWAEEVSWESLVSHVEADEGDMAMLILRTADHLRQLISLEKEYPGVAAAAREGVRLLMRSPLV